MGQINFVSDGEKKPEKKNKDNQEKKVEWSNPAPKVAKGGLSFKVVSKKEEEGSAELSQSKISSEDGESFFGKILSLLGLGEKEDSAKLKDKDVLAEHKENISDEKKNRKGQTSGTPFGSSDSVSSFLSKNRWKAARTLKTDLIKDEITTFFDWKKNLGILAIGSSLIFVVLGFFYGGIVVWEKKASEENRYKELEVENLAVRIEGMIKSMEEVDNLRDELKIASVLLDKHVYWTNFFAFLENNTLNSVSYSGSFSGDTLGKYNLKSKTDNFASLADQIRVMKENEFVEDIQVVKGNVESLIEGKEKKSSSIPLVGFDMSLTLNPKIFLNQKSIEEEK